MSDKLHLVIVTGMSGAGKTVAIQSFEDLGYFTIDNMPPTLLPKFLELIRHSQDNNKIALVVDMRSRSFLLEIREVLDEIEAGDGGIICDQERLGRTLHAVALGQTHWV